MITYTWRLVNLTITRNDLFNIFNLNGQNAIEVIDDKSPVPNIVSVFPIKSTSANDVLSAINDAESYIEFLESKSEENSDV